MTDLYAALGVPRDASAEVVHAAYRAAAKSAHPDAGGQPSRWALVQLARDVLSDAERRAAYDANGDMAEPARDSPLQRAVPLLSRALDQVLGSAGADVTRVDVVQRMRALLADRERQAHQHLAKIAARQALLVAVRGRFTTTAETNIETTRFAVGLLEQFRYRSDPVVMMTGYMMGLGGSNLFGNMGVT